MSTEIPSRWNRPIFIASMGRSGSTLLQRVINVHSEITIWGEHGGFLSGIFTSYELASEPSAVQNLEDGYESRHNIIGELADKAVFKPWVSPFRPADLEHSVTAMVRDLFTRDLDPSIRWGFKEIRYTGEELTTLMSMFPQAHVVILARDLEGFCQSRFFAFGHTDFDFETNEGREAGKKRLGVMSGNWIRRYQGMLALRDQYPNRSSVISYSDLTVGSSRPTELFSELGETPPPVAATDAVLAEVSGSSFKFNSAARQSRETLLELMQEAPIDWDEYRRLTEGLGVS